MSKKILIVEDEEVLLDVYKIKFSQTDYQIITAMDGLAGLELARKELPDLILLDLILPKMDGYQVINELKKDKNLYFV
ncbi:response regulator [Patescibacteria group bacterium]|nr:response regulator [Patescibacteria group bacterium]